MFAFILGANRSFNTYSYIVGFAYVVFLISSLVTLFLNLYFIPENLTPQEFNQLMTGSMLHGMIGKAGEYWALMLIAAGIYFSENSFSISKSLFISVFPSALILILKLIFGRIL